MPHGKKNNENSMKAESKKRTAPVTVPQDVESTDSGMEATPEIREIEELLLLQLSTATAAHEIEHCMWELASFYSRIGRQETALTYVNQLVERMDDPGKAAACYLAMGQLMEQMDDYKAALEYYEQAALLEPRSGRVAYLVNNNVGYCLNYFGRYEEAETYCRKAIAIDPHRHNAYKNLGISLEGQGYIVAAAQCYIMAVQANANDPRALGHLENLIKNHRGIVDEIKDINEILEDCRNAVKKAYERKKKLYEDEDKCSA